VRSTIFAEQSPRSPPTAETTYFKNLLQKNMTPRYSICLSSHLPEYIPLFKEKLYGEITSDLVNFERKKVIRMHA